MKKIQDEIVLALRKTFNARSQELKPCAYRKDGNVKNVLVRNRKVDMQLEEDNTIHFSLINKFLEIEKTLGLSVTQKSFCDIYFRTVDFERAVKESKITAQELEKISDDINVIRYMNLLEVNRKKVFEEKKNRSYYWKVNKLEQMIDMIKVGDDGELVFGDDVLKAMAEHNKMVGHYAPEKHINANVNADVNMDRMADVVDNLLKKHERDY